MKELAKQYNINIEGLKIKRVWMPFGEAFYTVLCSDALFVNKHCTTPLRMIEKVAHELKHREQYKRDGLIRYILIKLYGRLVGWAIGNPYEDEAYAEQERVDTLKREA